MIIFAQLNFFFKISPFDRWYFPIIWFGYIFVIDAVVYKLRKRSLITDYPSRFFALLLLSSLIWWMYEFINYLLGNWHYIGTALFSSRAELLVFGTLSFATVMPAIFETFDLLKAVHLFDKVKLKKKHKISRNLVHGLIVVGIFCLVMPIILPKYFFPIIWFGFFFLLDPINYLHKQPSIIRHLKDRKLKIPLALIFAGLVSGLLWEFWNYWAVIKWAYSIPFIDSLKIFEMPIIGYIGYPLFAFSLYAMFWFVHSLFKKKPTPPL